MGAPPSVVAPAREMSMTVGPPGVVLGDDRAEVAVELGRGHHAVARARADKNDAGHQRGGELPGELLRDREGKGVDYRLGSCSGAGPSPLDRRPTGPGRGRDHLGGEAERGRTLA